MKNAKILTKEIAERFLKSEGSVDLSKFSAIEDSAAKALVRHKGSLHLDGLERLSASAAFSLANIKNSPNDYNSLVLKSLSLTPNIALELSKYRGSQIVFGCNSISFEIVKPFRKFKGQLWLGKVISLDECTAMELSRRGGRDHLLGLKEYGESSGHTALALVGFNDNWNRHLASNVRKIIAGIKREHLILKTKSEKLQVPLQWKSGRISTGKAPIHPLKGSGNQRVKATEILWWLPRRLVDWFVAKLEDTHKVRVSGDGWSVYVSPEAAQLLRQDRVRWLWLMERESVAAMEHDRARLRALPKLAVPKHFRNGRVRLPPPSRPVADDHCWIPDRQSGDYPSILQFYSYLPSDHVGEITDANGCSAKVMSPEAADLYQGHRAFWEAKHAEFKAQTKAANQAHRQAVRQRVEKAAATAGLSRKELEAKLDRLAGLVGGGNLKLAAEMVIGFGDPWLYEALLASASITREGELKPGSVLQRFKGQAELIMLLAIATMPEGLHVDPSIRRDAVVNVTVTEDNVDLVAELVAPRLPHLKPKHGWMPSLRCLTPTTAAFLARSAEYLVFDGLSELGISEALALSGFNGNIQFEGLKKIDPGVAGALARINGRLSLGGLQSISESVATALAAHVGELRLGVTELEESVAAALAQLKGDLELPGLESISAPVAAALASHCGKLTIGDYMYFDGDVCFQLCSDASKPLARHAGPLVFPSLKRITPEAAGALSDLGHYLKLPIIEEFPDGIAGVRLCERLMLTPDGHLSVGPLKRIQAGCAAALAKFKGSLRVSVDDWCDAALLALAAHSGSLDLDPKSLSDEVGRALGQRGIGSGLTIRRDKLGRYGSFHLIDSVAVSLASYPGCLEFVGHIKMSKIAAAHLSTRNSIIISRSQLTPAVKKIFDSAGVWSSGQFSGKTGTHKP